MNEPVGSHVIKAITAFLCVVSICVTAVLSTGKITDAMIKSAEASSTISGSKNYNNNENNDTLINTVDESTNYQDENINGNSEDVTQAEASENSTVANNSSAATTTKKDSTSAAANNNSTPKTKADIITYCNNALNKAKAAKVGYDKHSVMDVKGTTTGSISSLIKLVTKDKTTSSAKGSDITDDFPAAGYNWSSKLRESDVSKATIKQNNQFYEITLYLGKEVNPAKGEASSYGRVMSVIDANGAKDMVPGIKSITMTYHNGYVYAKINSSTGNLVEAEFSAAADIEASISIFGNITAKDIISTETFTNIKW